MMEMMVMVMMMTTYAHAGAGWPHDNVDEHPEPRGDKHRLGLDHEVLLITLEVEIIDDSFGRYVRRAFQLNVPEGFT